MSWFDTAQSATDDDDDMEPVEMEELIVTFEISREFLTAAIERAAQAHPEWRYGQAVFNTAHAWMPDRSNRLRATDLDPFHRDDRASAFLDALFGAEEGQQR